MGRGQKHQGMCRLPEEFVLRWGLQSWGHPTTVPTYHRRQKATVWLPRKHPFLLHGLSVGCWLSQALHWERQVFHVPGTGARVVERPVGPDFGSRLGRVTELWGYLGRWGFEPWRQGQLCGLPASFGQL